MNQPFVLFHGSRHGGWAWKDVIRHLSEKGFRAHAPTLPGHGPDAMRTGITHEDCVHTVANYIQQNGLQDVTLVGP
jgi:pimeloyl-ACP methyl ester carboxylesterase